MFETKWRFGIWKLYDNVFLFCLHFFSNIVVFFGGILFFVFLLNLCRPGLNNWSNTIAQNLGFLWAQSQKATIKESIITCKIYWNNRKVLWDQGDVADGESVEAEVCVSDIVNPFKIQRHRALTDIENKWIQLTRQLLILNKDESNE